MYQQDCGNIKLIGLIQFLARYFLLVCLFVCTENKHGSVHSALYGLKKKIKKHHASTPMFGHSAAKHVAAENSSITTWSQLDTVRQTADAKKLSRGLVAQSPVRLKKKLHHKFAVQSSGPAVVKTTSNQMYAPHVETPIWVVSLGPVCHQR
jgi:hypothetical protein